MKDCFLQLLGLSSNQWEASYSEDRFGSSVLFTEEHYLKITGIVVLAVGLDDSVGPFQLN